MTEAGSAFWGRGGAAETYESTDPYEPFPDFFHELDSDTREFLQATPEWLAIASHHLSAVEGAPRMILSHCFNDGQILVNQVAQGDGRSAARTARSIFEHQVNLGTVIGSTSEADRYTASRHVTAARIGDLRYWWLELLDGTERRKEKQRLDKVKRKARQPLAAAKARFDRRGRPFEKNVFTDNLYDRARDLGMQDEYEAYRVLSGVVHGDAGGLLGLSRSSGVGTIHRLGPDLQLLPLAALYGFRWLADFTLTAHHEFGELPTVKTASEVVAGVVGRWPDIRRTAAAIDAQMWPDKPPPQPGAVAAFYGPDSAQIRWYHHDPKFDVVTVADVAPGSRDEADKVPERFAEHVAAYYAAGDRERPMTVRVLGVNVIPRSAARPWPAASVLTPRRMWEKADISAGEHEA